MGEPVSEGSTPAQPGFYTRLRLDQVLSEYDGPILFLATDPDAGPGAPKHWLLNWRAGGPRSAKSPALRQLSGVDQWLAVPVSERRRSQLLDEHVSLREAILLSEFEAYMLEGDNPLLPGRVFPVDVGRLEKSLLPAGDATVFGNDLPLPGATAEPESLRVLLHFVPGQGSPDSPNLAASLAIQECIQRFLSWGARALLALEQPNQGLAPTVIPVDDWAGLTLVGAAPGTLTVVAEAEVKSPALRDAMIAALRVLRKLGKGQADRSTGQRIGTRASASLVALTGLLHSMELSLSVKWGAGDTDEYAAIRGSGLERTRGQLVGAEEEAGGEPGRVPAAEFVVRLTATEVGELRKPVERQAGGFQALIDSLQQNLHDNVLRLTPYQVERVIRYAQDYGEGTYENRLRPVYVAIQRYGFSFVGLR